jgi:phage terminase large subunit
MRRITLDYGPFNHQVEFHSSSSRFRIITGGRRSGKSECTIQELIRHAISTPNGLSWYLAPTYNDAYEIGFAKFMEHIETLRPAIRLINHTKLRITWTNGHLTYFKGAENHKSLRGRGITFVALDEIAFMHPDVWYQIIRPALMDTGGSAVMLTTPNGRNWYYDLWDNSKRDPNFQRWHWNTSTNPLIPEEEIESARATMSASDFNQEIMAQFVTKAGMVYPDFNDKSIIDKLIELKNLEIGLGVDFGYANPTAIAFMAYNPSTEQVFQFDEIYKERTPIESLAAEIEDKLRMYGIRKNDVKVYTDPAGNAEELSSGISPVDFLRKKGFRVYNKGTEIAPGLALVRKFIRSADGRRSFFINEVCKESIRSMNGYTYEANKQNDKIIKEEPLKDGLHDHACLVGNTMVLMADNIYKPIRDIEVGDYVQTPKGDQRVSDHALIGTKPVYRLTLINGLSLIATGDHKIYTQRGAIRLDALSYSDYIINNDIIRRNSWKESDLMERTTTGMVGTIKPLHGVSLEGRDYIERYGDTIWVIYLMGFMFTMLMVIQGITDWRISACFISLSIVLYILKSEHLSNKKPIINTLKRLGHWLANGISLKKVSNGINNMVRRHGKTENQSLRYVGSVGKSTQPITLDGQSGVATIVKLRQEEDVYDITVENEHCFYANNILVSNCDAIRYYFVNKFDHAKYVAFKPDIEEYARRTEALKKTANIKRCVRCRRTFVGTTPKHEPPYHCPECIGENTHE